MCGYLIVFFLKFFLFLGVTVVVFKSVFLLPGTKFGCFSIIRRTNFSAIDIYYLVRCECSLEYIKVVRTLRRSKWKRCGKNCKKYFHTGKNKLEVFNV